MCDACTRTAKPTPKPLPQALKPPIPTQDKPTQDEQAQDEQTQDKPTQDEQTLDESTQENRILQEAPTDTNTLGSSTLTTAIQER